MQDWLLEPHRASGFIRSEVVSRVETLPYVHHTEYLFIKTSRRYALVNITELVEDCLRRAQIADGLCFVSTMHITAGIYINDAESGLLQDISKWIENLAPARPDYLHHQTGEDNADAHLKSFLTNHALSVPITRGQFDFGTWQQIFYAEFDGQREKRILVKLTGLAAK